METGLEPCSLPLAVRVKILKAAALPGTPRPKVPGQVWGPALARTWRVVTASSVGAVQASTALPVGGEEVGNFEMKRSRTGAGGDGGAGRYGANR